MTEPGGWTPDQKTIDDANLTRFITWLADTGRGDFADYQELWSASVADVAWFWEAIWNFFDVRATTPPDEVLNNAEMPGAQWFPGAMLNYVGEVFRHATAELTARDEHVVDASEEQAREVGLAVHVVDGVADAEVHGRGERVARLGPVHHDPRDARLRPFDDDGLVGGLVQGHWAAFPRFSPC